MPLTPTIDPLTNGLRFLIVDSTGAIPVDVTIPGGAYNTSTKVGWKVNGSGTSWHVQELRHDPSPLINGIQKMQLKKLSSPVGKFKFGVKGKNGNYPIDTAQPAGDGHDRDRRAVRDHGSVRRGEVPGGAAGEAELPQHQRRQNHQVQVEQ